MNGYFEEINKNKYSALVPTNESKEKIIIYDQIWSKIWGLIGSTTKKSDDYDERYMKIKFNSDDKLPLNKRIEIPSMLIVVRAIFLENNKHYLQVLNGLMLIRQTNQKSVIFVTIAIFWMLFSKLIVIFWIF